MKRPVAFFLAVCAIQATAQAQEPNPAAAADVAYDYLHSPERDGEIAWLKESSVKTPSNADQGALDLVTNELTSDLERLLAEQRELTRSLAEPSFFDLQSLTSEEVVRERYETLHRYIDLMKRNTLESWQNIAAERLVRSNASEDSKQNFLTNFMAGMEASFSQRLGSMGYSDKATFDQDLAQSERELLWWQEIFKMLQDTHGRWSFDPSIKQIVFRSEIEDSQFKRLMSKVAPRE
jgi:hypothetical protein